MHNRANDSKLLIQSAHDLKLTAEALKISKTEALDAPHDIYQYTHVETLHELEVHQIELELQNAQLLDFQAELENSQLRYKNLYDLAPVGYCTLNAEHVILENNLYTQQLLNKQGQYLVGQKFTDFIHPDDQDIYYLHCRNLQKANVASACELRIIQSSGQLIWVVLNQTLIESSTDQTVFYLAMSDISKLKATQVAAEAANKAKTTFLANMSHELRTPMNGVMGFAYLLKQNLKDPKDLDKIDKINHSANQLLNILTDILDLSKMEAEGIDLKLIPFDTLDMIIHARNLISDKSEAKQLELIVDIDTQLIDLKLMGDPARITQILLNYLNNAVKFTKHGKITLRAKLENRQADSVLLKFEVQDTGIGISEDQQANLFQAFSQADNSTTRQYGGTGLGLAISRGLAELMGGEAGVVSSPDQGSLFWFTACLNVG